MLAAPSRLSCADTKLIRQPVSPGAYAPGLLFVVV